MDTFLLSSGDFNQLRAFVAVAGSLNFSRAAESLGVSSSAVSQMIRALEERVGVSLFNRTTRSVFLTEAGAALFGRVKPAVEELAEALGETCARVRAMASCRMCWRRSCTWVCRVEIDFCPGRNTRTM